MSCTNFHLKVLKFKQIKSHLVPSHAPQATFILKKIELPKLVLKSPQKEAFSKIKCYQTDDAIRNKKYLRALTLAVPTRNNLVFHPLAVLHLDNRLCYF